MPKFTLPFCLQNQWENHKFLEAISKRNDFRPIWGSRLGGIGGGGLEEDQCGEQDEEKKVGGSEKIRAKGKKPGETPHGRKTWEFFEAVEGFKQNNIVHQQQRVQ